MFAYSSCYYFLETMHPEKCWWILFVCFCLCLNFITSAGSCLCLSSAQGCTSWGFGWPRNSGTRSGMLNDLAFKVSNSVLYDGQIMGTSSNIFRNERRWASALARMGMASLGFPVTTHLVKASCLNGSCVHGLHPPFGAYLIIPYLSKR